MADDLQVDVRCTDRLIQKEGCRLRKTVGIFCSQIAARTAMRELVAVLGMTREIVGERGSNKGTLRDGLNILRILRIRMILKPAINFGFE